MNGDEVRNVKFSSGTYDASQVNDLLERIAAELDAGRPAGRSSRKRRSKSGSSGAAMTPAPSTGSLTSCGAKRTHPR